MINHLKILGVGLLISWLGALPLGTLNITAFDIAASQGFQNAVWFALAAILVELCYVRLTLWGNGKLYLDEQWLSVLLPFGALLLLYLSFSSFTSVTSSGAIPEDHWASSLRSPILLGLLLSALNPMQVPFWLTWNKVLSSRNILGNTGPSHSFYMLGIGLGTLLALLLFIWLGGIVMADYQVYALYTNRTLGIIYLGFSLYLLFLFYQRSLKPIFQ